MHAKKTRHLRRSLALHTHVQASLHSPAHAGLHLRSPHRARRRSVLGVMRRASETERGPLSQNNKWWELPFLCVDLETTGLCSKKDRIIEVGGVRYQQAQSTASFSQLLYCERDLTPKIRSLTGIDPALLQEQPNVDQVLRPLAQQMKEAAFIVAYHVPFDRSFLQAAFARAHIPFPQCPWVDALLLARHLDDPELPMNLAQTAERWGILATRQNEAHRALPDAQMAGELLLKLAPHLGIHKLETLLKAQHNWRPAGR